MFSEKDYVDALKFCKEQNYPLDKLGVVTRIRPNPCRREQGFHYIEFVRLSSFLRYETTEHFSSCIIGNYQVKNGAEHSCCEMNADGEVDLKFYTAIGDLILLGEHKGTYGIYCDIVKNIRHEMMLENLKKAKNKVFGNLVENQKKK